MRSGKRRRAHLIPEGDAQYEQHRRILDAIARARRSKGRISLTQAARDAGTTVPTIVRNAPGVAEKKGGRWTVRRSDRLGREMHFLTARGQINLEVPNSRDASRIAKYMNAVRRFLFTGDERILAPFVGNSITVKGVTYPFVTDPATINRLARAGALNFLDIYAAPIYN